MSDSHVTYERAKEGEKCAKSDTEVGTVTRKQYIHGMYGRICADFWPPIPKSNSTTRFPRAYTCNTLHKSNAGRNPVCTLQENNQQQPLGDGKKWDSTASRLGRRNGLP